VRTLSNSASEVLSILKAPACLKDAATLHTTQILPTSESTAINNLAIWYNFAAKS
jgi:hypothetical protein